MGLCGPGADPRVMRCLVTDRRRLSGADTSFEVARRRLAAQVERAVADRVDIVLVRERDLDAARLAVLVGDLVRLSRSTDTRIVVNERLDVALATGADGVHLRADSFPASAVRRLTPPGFLVGRSVHTPGGPAEAGPVDYLVAGTVYPTPSKPGAVRFLGLEGFAAIARGASVPVFAIGGMTADRLDGVLAAGAAGVAGIELFIEQFDRPESRL